MGKKSSILLTAVIALTMLVQPIGAVPYLYADEVSSGPGSEKVGQVNGTLAKAQEQEQVKEKAQEQASELGNAETKGEASNPAKQANADKNKEQENQESKIEGEENDGAKVKLAATPKAAPKAKLEKTAKLATPPEPVEVSATDIWVDGTAGSDDNDGHSKDKPKKTLEAAVKALGNDNTLHLSGNFQLNKKLTIGKNAKVVVESDTHIKGNNNEGLDLASGTKMTTKPNATFKMTGFKIAMRLEKNSEINDGNYNFDGNSQMLNIKGLIKGTSKDKLVIEGNNKIKDKGYRNDNIDGGPIFWHNESLFENATVKIIGTKHDGRGQYDYGPEGGWKGQLKMVNADMELEDVRLTLEGSPYDLDMKDSNLSTKGSFKISRWSSDAHTMSIIHVAPSKIQNSTINVEGARFNAQGKFEVNDSKIILKDSRHGGLNVNYGGNTIFNNSVLESHNISGYPAYGTGAKEKSSITFRGNSVVNTEAKTEYDNGGANENNGSTYVVTGGSFLIKEPKNGTVNGVSAIPTNGEANGNEKLTRFKLSNPSDVNSLTLTNSLGRSYEYDVATSSSDGQKYVWVPAEKVNFLPVNPDSTEQIEAAFADGSKSPRVLKAMRGYTLKDGQPALSSGSLEVEKPSAVGYDFEGWYYKDDSGNEQKFDASKVKVTKPINVYAKWKRNFASYGIVYHNNEESGVIYTVSGGNPNRTIKVISEKELAEKNHEFVPKGKAFVSWNTKADGSGKTYRADEVVKVAADKASLDLYAQWKWIPYTVTFSANGGTFDKDSVFKKNPSVFKIIKDKTGGEVAQVIKTAKYDETLHELLGSFDYNLLKPDANAKRLGYKPDSWDEDYWYDNPECNGSSIGFWENPKITSDVTYYMKWEKDRGFVDVNEPTNISEKWVGSDGKDVNQLIVKAENLESGYVFDANVQVDVNLDAIKDKIKEKAKSGAKDISFKDFDSEYTTEIKIPAGIDASEAVVSANSEIFELKGSSVDGSVESGYKVKVVYKFKDSVKSTLLEGISGSKPASLAARVKTATLNFFAEPVFAEEQIASNNGKINIKISNLKVTRKVVDDKASANTNESLDNNNIEFKLIVNTDGYVVSNLEYKDSDNASQSFSIKQHWTQSDKELPVIIVVPLKLPLDADMQVDGNTTHEEVYQVYRGEEVKITGAIDPESIKTQMDNIEITDKEGKTIENRDINLSDLSSTFEASFTLPDGLELPSDLTKDKIVTENFGCFQVEKSEISDDKKTITVTLGLKDKEKADTYNTFEKLKTEVFKCGKEGATGIDSYMKLTVPKVKVLKDAPENENLVVKGIVSGDFYSKAKYHDTEKIYAFHWDGKQEASGRDYHAIKEGVDDIQVTLKVIPIKGTLQGDISIGKDTEHEDYYAVHRGDVISFDGALNMSKIQEQMGIIESEYKDDNIQFDQIEVNVGDVTFITTLTLPKGLTFSQPITKDSIKLENFGRFYIKDAVVEGNKVTITMKLYNPDDPEDTDHIANYQKLKKVVDDIGDKDKWMKIIVPGIKVDGDVKVGDMLTIFGTVDGTMQATADYHSKHRAFDFKWNTVQTDEGRDARFEKDKDFAAKTNKESITFTMIVKSSPNTPVPVNPENPVTPVIPEEPVVPTPVTPQTPQAPAVQVPEKPAKQVKTGDEHQALELMALMISAIGMLSAAILKRKNKKAD